MLRKILEICLAVLLVVTSGVQAAGPPDLLYVTDCLEDNDRANVRIERTVCDDCATGGDCSGYVENTIEYNVGIIRPIMPGERPYGGYGGCPENSTEYLCLGAPGSDVCEGDGCGWGGWGGPYGGWGGPWGWGGYPGYGGWGGPY